MAEPVCLIKCDHCKQQFSSPIQLGGARAFFTCQLVGTVVRCRKCGTMTPCNRENMYFSDRDGMVHHGSDTIPG